MLLDGLNYGNIDYVDNTINASDIDFEFAGRKNYLINGDFRIWQRGTSIDPVNQAYNAYIVMNDKGCQIGRSSTAAGAHYWGSACRFDAEL